MLKSNITLLIEKLIELDDSTTFFLESVRGDSLQMIIESQLEIQESRNAIIQRTVKLFFDSTETPVLYCESHLNKQNLLPTEYRSIMDAELPIGKVFTVFNNAESIKKMNISVTQEDNSSLAALLNVKSTIVFKKRYDYWVGDREVGHIVEIFNMESLDRALTHSKHYDVIRRLCDGNILCDENCHMQYSETTTLLGQLKEVFERDKQIKCVALVTKNSVAQAVAILYLLTERKNFFLVSDYTHKNTQLPTFCDKALLIKKSENNSFPCEIELTDNIGFIDKENLADSSLAFFSTSGTTGTVKYVCFHHQNLIENANNCIQRFGINSQSRVLVPVPISHMYGFGVGILPALIAGANICLIEKSNVLKLFDKLHEFNPDITLLTPAIVKMILRLGKHIPDNCTYISAGEKIDTVTHQRFESSYAPLINLYGCTELGAIATSPTGREESSRRTSGVLLPMDGVIVRLDDLGEIRCHHNAGFDCYVDVQGIQAESDKILTDGWFSTRDRGQPLEEKYFSVTGRIDNCINRSGFLVSLEEVESALLNIFMEIKQVIVIECDGEERLLSRLMAICELTADATLDEDQAKKICKEKLYRHWLPDEFYFVNEMPRLTNGKPDRFFLKNNYKQLLNIN